MILTVGAPAKSRCLELYFPKLMEVILAADSHDGYFPRGVHHQLWDSHCIQTTIVTSHMTHLYLKYDSSQSDALACM